MQITKELLLEKKQELLQRQEELLGAANAVNGALENIDYWLGVLEQPQEAGSAENLVRFPANAKIEVVDADAVEEQG